MPRSRARAGEAFYIHVVDPGFPDPPWPGERRLGPFLTAEEAEAQAVNDVAHGHIADESLVGVYSESESLKRKDVLRARWETHRADATSDDAYEPAPAFDPSAHRGGKSHVAKGVIVKKAASARRKLLANHALGIEDQRLALERLLPPGVSIDEMMAAAKSPEALAKLLGGAT